MLTRVRQIFLRENYLESVMFGYHFLTLYLLRPAYYVNKYINKACYTFYNLQFKITNNIKFQIWKIKLILLYMQNNYTILLFTPWTLASKKNWKLYRIYIYTHINTPEISWCVLKFCSYEQQNLYKIH